MAQRKKSNPTKKAVNRAKREAKKAAKKHPKAAIAVVCILLALAVVAGLIWYFLVYKTEKPEAPGTPGTSETPDTPDMPDTPDIPVTPEVPDTPDTPVVGVGNAAEIKSADLSIHFIAPSVKASGDCSLIKVGDTEVLIDAGPTQSNAAAIKEYVNEYCTDGILEYVIVTHGDADHISGMVGTSENGKYDGILYSYEIGTLIQFDRTNLKTVTDSGNPTLYGRYTTAVSYAQAQGAAVYTASQCWYEKDGAKKTYYLDESSKISLNILYNTFYEEDSKDENNYSVCMLLSQEIDGEESKHYLFTGDLEAEGEEELVKNNALPEVELYKAGHHGSKTSSNDCLLKVIKPKYVAVCCCAGYNQYGAAPENVFPTQAFVDRISKYTDKIYVTIMCDEATEGYRDMNGDVVFYYGKSQDDEVAALKLWCSNNSLILKDTEWFQKNRVWNGG